MTLFVVVMLPLVCGLGLWQLERAEEKAVYQDRYFDRLGMLPQAPPEQPRQADFQRVRLHGHYLPGRDFLVDNQVRNGRSGYWVVSVFAGHDGRAWLVNRGWLAAPASRDRLPAIPTPSGEQTLVGVIWPDTGLVPLLAADPWGEQWPKRVQRLDVSRMAATADSVVPVEVRLEPGQPGVFHPAPVDVDFSPRIHQGYAVQWFALAVALVAGYLIYGFRRT